MIEMSRNIHFVRMAALLAVAASFCIHPVLAADGDRIQPYSGNPFYWQCNGKPILLLGASDYHNIFQRADLVEHLDLMQSAGGNYVRNTMASREIKPGHNDLWPYRIVRKTNDPLINIYDLTQWNDEYWRRFERMLEETAARDIIVEVELWERHDCYRTRDQAGWLRHPFNPDNNINYTAEQSGLPTGEWTRDPGHPLFATVPGLNNNTLVLGHQQAFVDKVLSYTLRYDHVLYNMNNETKEHHLFGEYWADYILAKARAAGKGIELTDMQDAHDVTDASVTRVMDSQRYTFVDISQNNFQKQETHWQRIEHIRRHLQSRPRPVTSIKVYGSDNAPPRIEFWGNTGDGVERFWRNILGGCSSARFHRPDWGIGLNAIAQANVKSMRMLTDAMDVFVCEPSNNLLSERSPNEAYCLAEPGRQYAVYFPDGGEVKLDVSAAEGSLDVRWLDISRSEWRPKQRAQGVGILELNAPGKGHWAVLVRSAAVADRVGPWPDNPHYLAWGNTPVFPLGATGYHSWTPISRPGEVDFEAHMDRLAAVIDEIGSPHVCGFVRCLPYDPMNHMHDGPVKEVLQPWAKLADGRYDLKRFEPAWEKRLREYLAAALKRRIVVSLEVWDDWSVTRGPGGAYDPGAGAGWNAHPFNPRNNVNYDEDILPATTTVCDAPFYSTIPLRRNIETALALQKHYVDHLLAIASDYPNILISIANESRAHLEWSRFWGEYVRQRASSGMMIGEMPSTNRKDGGGECEHAFNPLTLCTDTRYDYVDIAQGVSGHEFRTARDQALGGGGRIAEYRRAMAEAGTRRPLVVSKDYTRGPDGGDMVLWGRFVGGAATARFHRPAGNHPESVSRFQHEAVGRLGRFIAQAPFWRMYPSPDLVTGLPAGAGANVLAEPAGHCVVQLIGATEGGNISLNLASGKWLVRWIDPASGRELARSEAAADATGLKLDVPGRWNHCIIHLAPVREP